MEQGKVLKLKSFSLSFGVQLFKALGDESRMRILNVLMHQGELSVTDIELILDFTQTKSARLMGVLKNAKLVQSKRVDHWVLYSVKEEATDLLGQVLDFMEKEPQMLKDIAVCTALNINRELSVNKLALKQYKPEHH